MKTVFKPLLTITLLVSALLTANAQRTGGGFDPDRLVYGGGIFPSFSSYGTTFSANPFLGYKVTDKLVPGVMFQYQYIKTNSTQWTVPATLQLFGVGPFVRYTAWRNIFLQAEYEFLNGSVKIDPYPKQTYSENNLLIGGGYFSGSGRSGIYAQLMYIPTWRGAQSVYSIPLIYRVGFSIF